MRLKKDFTFSDGGTVKVHEITASDLDNYLRMTEEASKATYEDAGLSSFAQLYYPILAVCTDAAPSLENSYKLDPCDLDNWFLLAYQLNTDFLENMKVKKYSEETIKIDGKNIAVKSRRPSIDIRLAQLNQQATKETPLENKDDEEYRLNGYVAAAAASFGNIPTAYQAKHELGLKEFSLWHKTVRKLIPEWYGEAVATSETAIETKKKGESASGNQ